MNLVTALAIVIGILGAVATWLVLGPLAGLASIWAVFIGWGSFFGAGGGEDGLKNSVVAGIWGAFCATIALVLNGSGALAGLGALGLPIIVGATVALMVFGSQMPMLSAIPAAVYGYASTAAFALLSSGASATSLDPATSPLVNVAISLAIGALFGFVSEKIAGQLVKK